MTKNEKEIKRLNRAIRKIFKICNTGAVSSGPANIEDFAKSNNIKSKEKAAVEFLKARFFISSYD